MLQKTPISETRGAEASEPSATTDQRVRAAWHAWLSALAIDPEAALAAAMAYEALDDSGRNAWLDALDEDAAQITVPMVAIYAPLLSVETEPGRRSRIQTAVGESGVIARRPVGRALRGVADDDDRIVAVVLPLYLDFVHVVACRIRPHGGFVWVKRDPIVHDRDAPRTRTEIEGIVLEQTPLKPIIEELAHAILAHRRSGRELPEALHVFVDLFQLGLDDES